MNPVSLSEAALEYAHKGWSVLPLHGIKHDRCTCGEPDCISRVSIRKRLGDSTTRPLTASRSRPGGETCPAANVRLRTGAESGSSALDLDSRRLFEEQASRSPGVWRGWGSVRLLRDAQTHEGKS